MPWPNGSQWARSATWNATRIGHGYHEPMSGSDAMKPTTSDVKLTYEDLLQLPEDGLRHEF